MHTLNPWRLQANLSLPTRRNRTELAEVTLFARTKRMHMDCTADAVSGCRVIACSCVCLQPLTHRPKLFLRCTSQSLVPGLQCLPSSASGTSVILPGLLCLQRVVVADLVPCPAEARLPPQGRLSSSSSWPRELGRPAPPGGAGHGLEHITRPHKRLSFSCPAGLLQHHDPPPSLLLPSSWRKQ